jgi:hypothetical protein
MPTGIVSTPSFEREIQTQIASLDAMFGDPELKKLRSKTPHHPAAIRRDALASFFPRRPQPYPELLALSAEVGAAMIDRQFWMPDPEDDYWSFIPNATAAARVAQNIRDPGKFNETLAELRMWASLRLRSVHADLIEEDGMPDIAVDRGSQNETWVEVNSSIRAPRTEASFERFRRRTTNSVRRVREGQASST